MFRRRDEPARFGQRLMKDTIFNLTLFKAGWVAVVFFAAANLPLAGALATDPVLAATALVRIGGSDHPEGVAALLAALERAPPDEQGVAVAICDAIRAAADGPLKGILGYTDVKNVPIDFNHNPHSSIYDAGLTRVMEGNLVKVISWYDNEWGFSCRMADVAVAMGRLA